MDTHELLPLPNTNEGWIAGFVATIILFFFYYWIPQFSMYEMLEVAYYESTWQRLPTQGDTDLMVQMPNTVSSLSAQQVIINITNGNDAEMKDVVVIVKPSSKRLLFQNTGEYETTLYSSDGQINFGNVKAGTTRVRGGWLILQSNIYSDDEVLEIEDEEELEDGCEFLLDVDLWVDGVKKTLSVNPDSESCIRISNRITFFQSLIRIILLPPWLNIALPISAIVAAGFREEVNIRKAIHTRREVIGGEDVNVREEVSEGRIGVSGFLFLIILLLIGWYLAVLSVISLLGMENGDFVTGGVCFFLTVVIIIVTGKWKLAEDGCIARLYKDTAALFGL